MAKVIVYTTSNCPYCVSAKGLLNRLNVDFEEIKLDHNQELRSKLSKENNGWRTVPMIFINDEFIGGFDDMKKLHDSGELSSKLKSK